jgi:hypothetical protein
MMPAPESFRDWIVAAGVIGTVFVAAGLVAVVIGLIAIWLDRVKSRKPSAVAPQMVPGAAKPRSPYAPKPRADESETETVK